MKGEKFLKLLNEIDDGFLIEASYPIKKRRNYLRYAIIAASLIVLVFFGSSGLFNNSQNFFDNNIDEDSMAFPGEEAQIQDKNDGSFTVSGSSTLLIFAVVEEIDTIEKVITVKFEEISSTLGESAEIYFNEISSENAFAEYEVGSKIQINTNSNSKFVSIKIAQ